VHVTRHTAAKPPLAWANDLRNEKDEDRARRRDEDTAEFEASHIARAQLRIGPTPPGSPRIAIFARNPAIRPTTIQVRIPMSAPSSLAESSA